MVIMVILGPFPATRWLEDSSRSAKALALRRFLWHLHHPRLGRETLEPAMFVRWPRMTS